MGLVFLDDDSEEKLTFDDVLIAPKFSTVESRSLVDIGTKICGMNLRIPVISSNMDTITGPDMCNFMAKNGAAGCLHRFWSVEENIEAFNESTKPIVSVGVGKGEFTRAINLISQGAKIVCVDVANGASEAVVEQVKALYEKVPTVKLIVGNFATKNQVSMFIDMLISNRVKKGYSWFYDNSLVLKIGIGGGSVCTTRIKTGVGYPQLSAIADCAEVYPNIIADGGIRTAGDIAKALAAGASAVMIGGMLSGTTETPGKFVDENGNPYKGVGNLYKKYRGSASKESYEAQSKDRPFITAEGESVIVPAKGSAKDVLMDIAGGLRSAFSYVGAYDLESFKKSAKFVRISSLSREENGAHALNLNKNKKL